MALGDKVEDLQRATAILTQREETTSQSLASLANEHKQDMRELAGVRREHEREIALLKREIEDLKRWKDDQKKEREEWGRRLWAFGPNVVAALLSGLISAIVAYFVARR
jgi:predicted RNase H-like nuclease (RuvC/YqgF family)